MVQQLARCEFKYAVRPEQLDDIRRVLRLRCEVDRTGTCDAEGWYRIDSLYFDTPSMSFFEDGEQGRAIRRKLRLRTYPDTPGSIVKIEVKRRIHELIVKTSTVVPYAGWQRWLQPGVDVSSMKKTSRDALNTFLTLQRQLDAGPRILVRYTRQAFHSTVDDYIRITFDRRMLYQRRESLDLAADERRWAAIDDPGAIGWPGALLMEVKFKNRAPVWIADLLRHFGLVRRGFSKYGSAVRRSRYGLPVLWDMTPAIAAGRGGELRSWIS